jgi:hypothetical protein
VLLAVEMFLFVLSGAYRLINTDIVSVCTAGSLAFFSLIR